MKSDLGKIKKKNCFFASSDTSMREKEVADLSNFENCLGYFGTKKATTRVGCDFTCIGSFGNVLYIRPPTFNIEVSRTLLKFEIYSRRGPARLEDITATKMVVPQSNCNYFFVQYLHLSSLNLISCTK